MIPCHSLLCKISFAAAERFPRNFLSWRSSANDVILQRLWRFLQWNRNRRAIKRLCYRYSVLFLEDLCNFSVSVIAEEFLGWLKIIFNVFSWKHTKKYGNLGKVLLSRVNNVGNLVETGCTLFKTLIKISLFFTIFLNFIDRTRVFVKFSNFFQNNISL